MKFKLNTNRLVNIAIIVVFVLMVTQFRLFFTHVSTPTWNSGYDTFTATSTLKPFDTYIPTDLPHDKYEALKQKNEVIRALKNGEWLGGSGSTLGWFMATTDGQFCDTCTVNNNNLNSEGVTRSYLKLPGWKLNPQPDGRTGLVPSEFHVEHGQSYVRKFVTSKVLKKSNGNHYTVHQVDEPVKFRYNSKDNCIMIPVSATTKNICTYILLGFGISLFVYIFYLIAAFLKFIIDLSKGLSFTTNNVNRLRLIAFSLIGYPVVMFLLTLLARLLFNSYFTGDIILNSEVWSKSWPSLSAGIVFLLLFRAFRQGKALKEELDLTV